MKLTVLADNNTFIDMYYLGEPGVSYYIEDGEEKILFDTGYSNVFMENAKSLNIDLDKVTKLVISHGHDDHTGGLKDYLNRKRELSIIAHPNCFDYKEDETGLFIGSPYSKEALKSRAKLNLSTSPVQVTKNITFLGEIPRSNDFENKHAIGQTKINDEFKEDNLIDDSAICYKSETGLFIITGCSHSGICNIIEYAKKVCNDNRILGVIGGFHLFEVDERLEKTIEYLKSNNIKMLYPCHCVSLKAKIEMGKTLDILETGVGLEIDI